MIYSALPLKVRDAAKVRDLYYQAPHLTQGITRESDKNIIKHHKQESQEVSSFKAGHRKTLVVLENGQNLPHRYDIKIYSEKQ